MAEDAPYYDVKVKTTFVFKKIAFRTSEEHRVKASTIYNSDEDITVAGGRTYKFRDLCVYARPAMHG